jgi:hypothetical protein
VDFVACWAAVDGVAGVLVDDFEGSGFCDVEIFEAWFVDGALFDDEAGAVGILFAYGDGVSFFDLQCIFVSIDGRIDSQGEDMLMVSCKDLIMDHSSVRDDLVVHGFVNGLGRENSGGTNFEMDISRLTKLPCLELDRMCRAIQRCIHSWQL